MQYRIFDLAMRQMIYDKDEIGTKFAIEPNGNIVNSSDGYSDRYGPDYKQKDLIVQLWTGIKDESGKKVYEGDIIEVQVDTPYLASGYGVGTGIELLRIEISINPFGVYYNVINQTEKDPFHGDEGFLLALVEYDMRALKVLGNKYQNPELLK